MESRTKCFALRVLKLCRALPRTPEAGVIRRQLARAGASVGANYRASGRARSRKEFLSKLGNVEEETDESCYWLELIIEDSMKKKELVQPLLNEAQELLSIIVASRKRTRRSP
jgi:four helix bundle protein